MAYGEAQRVVFARDRAFAEQNIGVVCDHGSLAIGFKDNLIRGEIHALVACQVGVHRGTCVTNGDRALEQRVGDARFEGDVRDVRDVAGGDFAEWREGFAEFADRDIAAIRYQAQQAQIIICVFARVCAENLVRTHDHAVAVIASACVVGVASVLANLEDGVGSVGFVIVLEEGEGRVDRVARKVDLGRLMVSGKGAVDACLQEHLVRFEVDVFPEAEISRTATGSGDDLNQGVRVDIERDRGGLGGTAEDKAAVGVD